MSTSATKIAWASLIGGKSEEPREEMPNPTPEQYALYRLQHAQLELARERIPLRKWAIEQALARGANYDLLEIAAEIEAWVLRDADPA